MPTTARLVAAIIFAAIGWYSADLVKPLLPEGMAVGKFSPVSAGFGILVGWFFTGKRLHRGRENGIAIGLASSFLLVFWVLLAFSGQQMLRRSVRKLYDGPVEALQDMFGLAAEYLILAAIPSVIATLVIGGMVGGWITEQVAKRWS